MGRIHYFTLNGSLYSLSDEEILYFLTENVEINLTSNNVEFYNCPIPEDTKAKNVLEKIFVNLFATRQQSLTRVFSVSSLNTFIDSVIKNLNTSSEAILALNNNFLLILAILNNAGDISIEEINNYLTANDTFTLKKTLSAIVNKYILYTDPIDVVLNYLNNHNIRNIIYGRLYDDLSNNDGKIVVSAVNYNKLRETIEGVIDVPEYLLPSVSYLIENLSAVEEYKETEGETETEQQTIEDAICETFEKFLTDFNTNYKSSTNYGKDKIYDLFIENLIGGILREYYGI